MGGDGAWGDGVWCTRDASWGSGAWGDGAQGVHWGWCTGGMVHGFIFDIFTSAMVGKFC